MCYMKSKTGNRPINAAVTNVNKQIASPNPYRIGLLLNAHPTITYTIWFGNPAVVGAGIAIPPNTQSLYLSREQWGDSLTQDISVIGSAAGPSNVCIVEVMEMPQLKQDQQYGAPITAS